MPDMTNCLCGREDPPLGPGSRPLPPGMAIYAKCEACEKWQHVVCMGVRDMFEGRAVEPDHYFCHECAKMGWDASHTEARSGSPTSQAHAETWEAIERGERERNVARRRVEAWRKEPGHGGADSGAEKTTAVKDTAVKTGKPKLILKHTASGSTSMRPPPRPDKRAGGVQFAPVNRDDKALAGLPIRDSGALAERATRVPIKVQGTGEEDSPERSSG